MELLKRATSFCRVNKILHGFQGERSPAIKISMMFPQYYRSKTSKGYLNKGPRWDYNTNDMKNNYKIGRAHSELQSRQYLVCRLLLEKKKKKRNLCETMKIKRKNAAIENKNNMIE